MSKGRYAPKHDKKGPRTWELKLSLNDEEQHAVNALATVRGQHKSQVVRELILAAFEIERVKWEAHRKAIAG